MVQLAHFIRASVKGVKRTDRSIHLPTHPCPLTQVILRVWVQYYLGKGQRLNLYSAQTPTQAHLHSRSSHVELLSWLQVAPEALRSRAGLTPM